MPLVSATGPDGFTFTTNPIESHTPVFLQVTERETEDVTIKSHGTLQIGDIGVFRSPPESSVGHSNP